MFQISSRSILSKLGTIIPLDVMVSTSLSQRFLLKLQRKVVTVSELKFLHDWSTKNELFIHAAKKTEYVIFGTAMKRNQINSGNLSGVI